MNAISHAIAALCSMLIGVAVMGLGLLEGALIAGFVGFLVMMVIAWALFQRAEVLIGEESIGRRHYKGSLN